ncbi:C40 family peptidase [Streptosporangiaceae bacterium NEAU-GS5]|nr:C40 family peptidase [Streptosporangiaceae bacterium NEAU-GS5]
MKRAIAVGALLAAAGSAPVLDQVPSVVRIAYELEGSVPYAWGGGHGAKPGPSKGTCKGYHGTITPCPAARTTGVDCSGFARWVFRLAYGRDVLGRGNTDAHIRRLQRVDRAEPGDLVFYGTPRRTHHVGVYMGAGQMVSALRTGTKVRMDDVRVLGDIIGYYRLTAADA